MDVRAFARDQKELAKETTAEVREHEGNASVRSRHSRDVEGIGEADIEGARKAELVADPDFQDAAVHEHDSPVLGHYVEDRTEVLLPEVEVMHRGKEAQAAKPELSESAPRALESVGGLRVEHEVRNESLRVGPGRRRHGFFVTRNARDQDGLRDSVPIELSDPSRREPLGSLRRKLEGKLLFQDLGRFQARRKRPEEIVRKEVGVGIRDSRDRRKGSPRA